MRDVVFYAKALEVLRKPSQGPRFIFVSTNWNHGPHGEPIKVAYPGPFDPNASGSPILRDYINRLNDTVTHLAEFERDVNTLERPVAVLAYGDHQPGFPMVFDPDFVRSLASPDLAKQQTIYRFSMRGALDAPIHESQRIERLASQFLSWAGIPPSNTLALVDRLRLTCGPTLCSGAAANSMISVMAR